MLPDAVDARLRLEAKRRGTSIAALAREAIEVRLPSPRADGRLGFFAIGELSDRRVRTRRRVRVCRNRRAPLQARGIALLVAGGPR